MSVTTPAIDAGGRSRKWIVRSSSGEKGRAWVFDIVVSSGWLATTSTDEKSMLWNS